MLTGECRREFKMTASLGVWQEVRLEGRELRPFREHTPLPLTGRTIDPSLQVVGPSPAEQRRHDGESMFPHSVYFRLAQTVFACNKGYCRYLDEFLMICQL